MIHDLVDWMDDHFSHDLTNIVVNATAIGRGVDLAFQHPRLRALVYLKNPIKLLLQSGFAREYRHQSWGQIVVGQGYYHVVNEFSGASMSHLPEAKAAIAAALAHIASSHDR